ncbi:phospholipid carrier-dependent glycosyltransferase [Nonomuraea typhae]|uniref:phospholipid carrier-dependent glycosyltransferase n=1 Tax=Nonomuraea typhae TaxID=2603600 RepID=UPI001FE4812A|nr:phospholipid carrier-dependent glycosyltransferase [Nonomuraea typhae]
MTTTLIAAPVQAAPAASRGHRLFLTVLALGAALRVLVMLAYDTAQLYWYDSFTYLDTAVHMRPSGAFHPAGYSWFLWLLRPFRSVELIAGLQHVMGLGVAVMIYLLLRRRGLPAWAATLAAVPVLFDTGFLRLEHAILSDLQVIFLLVAAMSVLLWHERVSARAAAVAGLLLALAGLTRTAAVPLIGLALLYLLVRRTPWRTAAAMAVTGLLPLASYAGWYAQHHGRFALSGSDGVALWARTMTFADCARIRPPADLAPLCPNDLRLDAASEYVWDPRASLNLLGDRFARNDAARRFAVAAITAQPLDYLREVAGDTSLAFAWTPIAHPKRVAVPDGAFPIGRWRLPEENPLIGRVRAAYDPDIRGQSTVEPFAGLLARYRWPWLLHGGPLFALLLLAGAAGLARGGRAALLPWAAAVFLLVAPVAALDFDHRYVLPAIPLACVAAALALHGLRPALPRGAKSP